MTESIFFDTAKRNFKDVPIVDDKISTTEFLEAAESVVDLFKVLNSKAFIPVQSDMTGNIKKIRDRQLEYPNNSHTLQDLCAAELADKKQVACGGLLWLNRGLEFTSQALRKNVESQEEMVDSFTAAYGDTLKKHHNIVVKGAFSLAMKACPYRADFYSKLGNDQNRVKDELREWLTALECIVTILNNYFATINVK